MSRFNPNRIHYADLKRIVLKMREHGMSEAEVMWKVLYCFNDCDIVED